MELGQQKPTPITLMLSQSWQVSLSARDVACADALVDHGISPSKAYAVVGLSGEQSH